MTKDEGIPLSGAAPKFPTTTEASLFADQAVQAVAANEHEIVPLVMVSELPEEAMPNPDKFPLWIRGIIFGLGAVISWGLVYALVHRG